MSPGHVARIEQSETRGCVGDPSRHGRAKHSSRPSTSFPASNLQDVDARNKCGHDGVKILDQIDHASLDIIGGAEGGVRM